MNTQPDVVEAYKSIIDFNKTIISISSTVLAALIAYLIFQDSEFEVKNYIGLGLLVLSIILSITGFGKAIETVKDGASRKGTILVTNIGAYLLIIGIVSLLLIKCGNKKNIDEILKDVEKTTTLIDKNFSKNNWNEIIRDGEFYHFVYLINNQKTEIIYSIKLDKITKVKKTTPLPHDSHRVVNNKNRTYTLTKL